ARPVDAEGRKLFERIANYYAGQLLDANVQRDGMSRLVNDVHLRRFNNQPRPTEFFRVDTGRRTYNEEFGKALAAALEPTLLESSKPLVRINAARLMADTAAKAGATAAAETFLKVLANPSEMDAVKFWALRGLTNLFALVPEK